MDINKSQIKENKSFFNDIKLIKGELIGKGTFGNVYKCLEEETGKLIVMKEILLQDTESKRNGEKQIESMKSEIRILKELRHNNIVGYIGTNLLENMKGAGIVMEYMAGGSIKNLLNQFGKLDENISRVYLV